MPRLNRPNLTRHQPRPKVILTPLNPTPNLNSNTSDPSNTILLKDIATPAASPGLWIINGDVTITSNDSLGFEKGDTVVTSHNFTNNGYFGNSGTFLTLLNFTNNSDVNNNGGFILNTGNLVFNPNTKQIFNRDGNIINFGTYSGNGRITGNRVQTSLPCSPPS